MNQLNIFKLLLTLLFMWAETGSMRAVVFFIFSRICQILQLTGIVISEGKSEAWFKTGFF